jgi:hypothetical protein
MTALKPGDIVTATVDRTWIGTGRPDDQPFTIIGSVYELPDHPGMLWVGSYVVLQDDQGAIPPGVTVHTIRRAPEQVQA